VKLWSEIPLKDVIPNVPFERYEWNDVFSCSANRSTFPLHHRQVLVTVLNEQYNGYQLSSKAQNNIQSLLQEHSRTITTGQQLVAMGGPWMIFFKILTCIQQSRKWNQEQSEFHYIPIFWLASEDHDWPEIAQLNNGRQRHHWSAKEKGAVGRMDSDAILQALLKWNQQHPDDKIPISALDAYVPGEKMAKSFRSLLHQVFGETELIILDPDHPKLKSLFIPVMEKEIRDNWASNVMQSADAILGEVEVKSGNLFRLSPGDRKRLEWVSDQDEQKRLILELNAHPEDFSPGVVLRPIYQETILPNVMYVGGPSELKYWNQLSPLLQSNFGFCPLIQLRERGWVVNEKWLRKWDRFQWPMERWMWSKKQWEDTFREQFSVSDGHPDLDAMLNSMSAWASQISLEDPTLGPAILAEQKRVQKGIQKLNAKILKSRKKRDEVAGDWFRNWFQEVHPFDHLQERETFWYWEWSKGAVKVEDWIDSIDPQRPSAKIWAH
jgi:bacillithiol biosynthesis cysteine-adding enzyme BshC